MTNILCQRVSSVGVRNSRPPHQTGFSRQQTNDGPRQLNDANRRRHLSPHRRCADRSCSARITRPPYNSYTQAERSLYNISTWSTRNIAVSRLGFTRPFWLALATAPSFTWAWLSIFHASRDIFLLVEPKVSCLNAGKFPMKKNFR